MRSRSWAASPPISALSPISRSWRINSEGFLDLPPRLVRQLPRESLMDGSKDEIVSFQLPWLFIVPFTRHEYFVDDNMLSARLPCFPCLYASMVVRIGLLPMLWSLTFIKDFLSPRLFDWVPILIANSCSLKRGLDSKRACNTNMSTHQKILFLH